MTRSGDTPEPPSFMIWEIEARAARTAAAGIAPGRKAKHLVPAARGKINRHARSIGPIARHVAHQECDRHGERGCDREQIERIDIADHGSLSLQLAGERK